MAASPHFNAAHGVDVGDGRTSVQRVPPKARRVRPNLTHPCFQGETNLRFSFMLTYLGPADVGSLGGYFYRRNPVR